MTVLSRSKVVSGGAARVCVVLSVWLSLTLSIGCDDEGETSAPRPDAAVDLDAAVDAETSGVDQTEDDADEVCDFEAEPVDLEPEVQELANGAFGCENVLLAPDEGEEGSLSAARLTPPAYPFAVESIAYGLGHGPSGTVTCNATYEHQLYLFADAGASPPESPELLADLTIPAVEDTGMFEEGRYVAVDLDTPVTLTEGEHLFVAISLEGTHPDVMCVSVDIESAALGNRNYWTSSAEAPYEWVQLDSFGLDGSILVMAYGRQTD